MKYVRFSCWVTRLYFGLSQSCASQCFRQKQHKFALTTNLAPKATNWICITFNSTSFSSSNSLLRENPRVFHLRTHSLVSVAWCIRTSKKFFRFIFWDQFDILQCLLESSKDATCSNCFFRKESYCHQIYIKS